MNKAQAVAINLAMTIIIAVSATRSTVSARLRTIDKNRGDVPGWAIASGAACALALLVYAAYSAVISKWIAKIQ
jgi:hypothetical protein